jgi:hypothetical protein
MKNTNRIIIYLPGQINKEGIFQLEDNSEVIDPPVGDGNTLCTDITPDESTVSSEVTQDENSVSNEVTQDENPVSCIITQDESSVSNEVTQDENPVSCIITHRNCDYFRDGSVHDTWRPLTITNNMMLIF